MGHGGMQGAVSGVHASITVESGKCYRTYAQTLYYSFTSTFPLRASSGSKHSTKSPVILFSPSGVLHITFGPVGHNSQNRAKKRSRSTHSPYFLDSLMVSASNEVNRGWM